MKIMRFAPTLLFALIPFAGAQDTRPGKPMTAGPLMKQRMIIRTGDMGKWWKDSDVASKLQLGDDQIGRLDQIFYEHRMKLIDYTADMEKQDLKLQNLLDADVPNDGQVQSQVDQVLAARGRVEREFTLMNLDLRKALSLDQWHQLRAIREKRGFGGDNIFYHRVGPGPQGKFGPGAPDSSVPVPLPPPPPEGGLDVSPEPMN